MKQSPFHWDSSAACQPSIESSCRQHRPPSAHRSSLAKEGLQTPSKKVKTESKQRKLKCKTKRFKWFGYQSQRRVHERSLLVVGRLVAFVATVVLLTLPDFWEAMDAESMLILLLQGIARQLFRQELTGGGGFGRDVVSAILCPGIDLIKTGPGKSSKVETSCVMKSSMFFYMSRYQLQLDPKEFDIKINPFFLL